MTALTKIKDVCGKVEEKNNMYLRRSISFYITWFLIKLKFTGNQVSSLGLLLGMLSCIFFISGDKLLFFIGGIILFFGQMMDYCDGEVARYRKVKKMPDELMRKYGGGFDSLNHIAPSFAIICMAFGLIRYTNHQTLLLFIGFLAAAFQFIRGGFFSYLTLLLKIMGKKYESRNEKKRLPMSSNLKFGFIFPHMIYVALFLSVSSLFDLIARKRFTLFVFIIFACLISIQALMKLTALSTLHEVKT